MTTTAEIKKGKGIDDLFRGFTPVKPEEVKEIDPKNIQLFFTFAHLRIYPYTDLLIRTSPYIYSRGHLRASSKPFPVESSIHWNNG